MDYLPMLDSYSMISMAGRTRSVLPTFLMTSTVKYNRKINVKMQIQKNIM